MIPNSMLGKQRAPNSKLPRIMRPVTKKVLENGLKVFLIQVKELPVVSHWIWYSVGARDERSGETGVSHFLEHMMFKGTRKYPKGSIDLITARLGGNNNAFTSNDYTAYYFNLKSDRFVEAMKIEASRMRGCLLDPIEFDLEKKVVLEELQRGEDDPWQNLFQGVESASYMVHPYRHPVIGWREDIERLTLDGMRDYYRRHYSPDRANLVLAGDFNKKEALDLVEKHFGKIPPGGNPREEVLHEPRQKGEKRVIIRSPAKIPRFGVAWQGCSVNDDDDVLLDVVNCLLSLGKSSRLYQNLVKGKELASFAQSYNESRMDAGLFWMISEPKPGVDPKHLEEALFEEVERLKEEGPSVAELKRIKKAVLTSFYFQMETVSDQAQRVGQFETIVQGGTKTLEAYPGKLQAVRPKQIKEVMRKYFEDDRRTIGWSLPEAE
jgi:zinc protease